MSSRNDPARESRWPFVIAYVILVTLGVVSVSTLIEEGRSWGLVAGLLVIFGILMAFMPDIEKARPWKHLYMLAQTVITTFPITEYMPGVFMVLNFVLSAQAMTILPRREGLIWIGILTITTGFGAAAHQGWSETLMVIPIYAAGYLFFGVFAQLLTQSDDARKETQRLLHELEQAHLRLQDYSARAEELAVIEERNRLAREMHDTLGHRLTVAAVQLEGAQRLCSQDPDRAANMVGTVREQVKEALTELRGTVATLRAPVEVDLALRSSLRRLAQAFEEATGLPVNLTLPEEISQIPREQRLALYRGGQEALTNVQRHAGASQVWLTLMDQDEQVVLLVSDDGVGFPGEPAKETSFGLRGLKERVEQLGGNMVLDDRPGGGAQLRLSLPLESTNTVQP
jgi:signal transduction histidine kinase